MINCSDCQLEISLQQFKAETIMTAPGMDDDRFFCKPCFDARFEYSIDERGHYIVTADRFEVKV